MGFGGSVSAMISSLKNNKRERKSAFKKMKEHTNYSSPSDRLVFKNKATEEELDSIRKRLQLENKRKLIINAIGLSIIAMGIAYFLIQLKF
ncbi:hypothetical protein ACOSP6_04410 [Tenacibaculum sp. MEBiC06402]|uniref:hypothetical protein n=1 Tax=unclassified Tenacibaculum TaxID=2635139 RepID=UPI003B9927A9